MSRRNPTLRFLSALLPAVLTACSSGTSTPRAVLDERTGVTINAVSAPMLFVRIHGDASSGSRDYVTLVAAEKDNAGKYTDLFLMYRWSVSFHGMAPQPPEGAGRMVLQADGREIVLQPLDAIPVDLSRSKDLFVPEGERVVKYAYQINFDTMRAIAESHELKLRLPQEPEEPDTPFTLWRDGRPALGQLVNQLNGS